MLMFNGALDLALVLLWFMIARRRREHEAQEKLLAGQELFFGRLAGQYARSKDLSEALWESAGLCGTGVQREVMRLMQALSSDELSEEAGGYAGCAKNAYFVLFFTLCRTIRSFGDLQLHGVSLFTHNIRYIKEEVRIELLRRQEGHYAFLGLTMLSIVPFFFTLPIRWWSGTVSAGMKRYYSGAYGFTILSVCFFLTVVCALSVQELQYPDAQGRRESACVKHILSLPLACACIDRHIARHYGYYLKKNEVLKVLQGFGNIREFLVKKLLAAAGLALLAGMLVCGSVLAGGRFRGISLLAVLLCALAGFFLPDAWVIVLQERVKRQKMEETMRFETLILIVMHYRQITVEEILRWMERFSVVFSRAFERAVDDFSYHRREALERLKEELAYEPAEKLVDGLIACDEIPVAQAFYDMEGERAYDMEQYRKKQEAGQREKAALARVIAFLPFVAVLALWMIVPFVAEGLAQLKSY